MDARRLSFLQAVAGTDGARALAKAVSRSAELEWALFPRAVMAWLDVVARTGYDDRLPGVPDVSLALAKTETGLAGSVSPDKGQAYVFSGVTPEHVAAAVAVLLGADADRAPALRSPILAKLGKSLDLLVKSRTLRKVQRKPSTKRDVPGAAAQPIAPQAPEPPQKVEDEEPKATPQVLPPKRSKLKLTKAEAAQPCRECGSYQFHDGQYIGCFCFADGAPAVKTVQTQDGYTLSFGVGWDPDAVAALAQNFGR